MEIESGLEEISWVYGYLGVVGLYVTGKVGTAGSAVLVVTGVVSFCDVYHSMNGVLYVGKVGTAGTAVCV